MTWRFRHLTVHGGLRDDCVSPSSINSIDFSGVHLDERYFGRVVFSSRSLEASTLFCADPFLFSSDRYGLDRQMNKISWTVSGEALKPFKCLRIYVVGSQRSKQGTQPFGPRQDSLNCICTSLKPG